VIDAKFKRLGDGPIPHGDAYQILAYCTAFGLADGFLVYAHDEKEKPRSHRVRDGGVRIEVRTVDVAAPPDALLASVERLAAEVAKAAGEAGARRGATGARRRAREALSG
jgi:5-methylcytosine-specific restriction enzyme subunit McrC